ncbi:MAG TPA: 2-C-methyl-D-erythritol 4-phosphate cytidylyltransferase [Bacteroidetes bacterium]|nr:2-C-methyl-D-erythritol 4-phosphate cytidylyltransferase [Bacteroidota bacterium]
MKVTAIIPAAGTGKRMGTNVHKQFLRIGDKPILFYTLEKFESCPLIDAVILVLPRNGAYHPLQELLEKYNIHKIQCMVAGGEQRQDSVYAGLQAVDSSSEIVVIHDAVRPLIRPELIEQSIRQCQAFGAVVVAVPVTATIKKVQNTLVVETLDRRQLWEIQTPQTFNYQLILQAYRQAMEEEFYGTDDAMLVERLGHEVKILQGDRYNLKITTPDDLIIAECLLRRS